MKLIPLLSALSLLCLLASCTGKPTLFVLLDNKKTGITFRNDIKESDSLNILNNEFVYNGGGVGVGDVNGDGLPDLYFTGNQVENKLYLNRGNLHFEDVTQQSGAQKKSGQWSSGINMIDINRDGRTDIYVCNTFLKNPEKRKNNLFINQGNGPDGIPQFVDMAAEYGVADTTHSSHAQFFDSDNDGDLDLFVGVNEMDTKIPNRYITKVTDGTSRNCDRLYRNDGGAFTDVSRKAGINLAGFSHSTLTADFNADGWQDIYVANDYVSNDLLYINNHNGTFSNQIAGIFKHQAASAMGSDLGDINNDGLPDLFTTEMLPYYNKRKKLFLGGNNYATYINNDQFGYEYQYGRNVLQLNRGINPETGLPVFSDVSFITGTHETEWSWAPLFADFDNDGLRDLFVTNGFPKDVTDHDFSAFFSSKRYLVAPMDLQEDIPQVKSPKFLFHNNGDLKFDDISENAGVNLPAFSNGSIYADLDLDGDLDLVVNNIDDEAFVFKNTLNDREEKPDYLRITLVGRPENPDAIGAEVIAYYGGKSQQAVVMSGRGYLSCPERTLHFGLGKNTPVDSIEVRWGCGERSVLKQLALNQTHTIRYTEVAKSPLLLKSTEITTLQQQNAATIGLDFVSDDNDYVDFNAQPTLPHKLNQFGPGITVGDVTGDGLDDLVIPGSAQHDASLFTQHNDGTFSKQALDLKKEPGKMEEDLGSLLFDADGDGDLDLFIARGSPQQSAGWSYYQDVLFTNDGSGHFTAAPQALPLEKACNQAAKAADFDGDGDLDLFVGGRVMPKNYPKPDQSFLLRNDTKRGGPPVFTDVTAQYCPELSLIGMVSDAIWTDFNQDNRPDLLLAGEWMPLVFLQNDGQKLVRLAHPLTTNATGWWTSLAAADFDNDGDTDYLAGNYGQNTYFQGDADLPLHIYAKDFDNNGVYDPFISCFWQDSLGRKREYFYHTRDDMLKQLITIRKKFNTYGQFGEATVQDVFSKKDLEDAQILEANWMSTSYVENLGNGTFKLTPLPNPVQLAPVFGMLPFDCDADGLTDVIMVGNDYGMELLQGRADAFYGMVLHNLGSGNFQPLEIGKSGFVVPGDGRSVTRICLAGGASAIVATQNAGAMKVFIPSMANAKQTIRLTENEVWAEILFQQGQRQRREFFRGNGFLSQESRTVLLPNGVREMVVYDGKGRETRRIKG